MTRWIGGVAALRYAFTFQLVASFYSAPENFSFVAFVKSHQNQREINQSLRD